MSAGARWALLLLLALVVGLAIWLVGSGAPAPLPADELPSAADADASLPALSADVPEASSELMELDAALPPADAELDDVSADAPSDPGPPPGHARLDVLVVADVDGRPVAGVRVLVTLAGTGPGAARSASALSDVRGLARFERPAPLVVSSVRASSGSATGGARLGRRLGVADGETHTVELRVPNCGRASGVVVDELDQPVAHARVLAWARSARSLEYAEAASLAQLPPDAETVADAAGRFELPCAGPSLVATAEAPGRVCVSRADGRLEPGEAWDDLRLVLAEAWPLDVRVRFRDGRPAEGARVVVDGGSFFSERSLTSRADRFVAPPRDVWGLSNADGRLRLPALPGRRLRVTVQSPEAVPVEVSHDPRDGELLVELDAGCLLTGVVLGADGQTLSGARVRLEGEGLTTRRTRSDDEGRFRMAGLEPASAARLLALADDHAPLSEGPVVLEASGDNHVELRLARGLSLSGRVVDPAGEALASASVVLRSEQREHGSVAPDGSAPTPEKAWGLDLTTTAADGRFAFGQLHPGPVELEVVQPDDPSVRRRFVSQAGDRDLELVFEPAGRSRVTFVGRVHDASSGQPVPRFDVLVYRPTLDDEFTWETHSQRDTAGQFVLTDQAPGEILLMIVADGYRNWVRQTETYAAGEHDVDVELVPERSLSVRVLDGEGRPAAGATVMCTSETGRVWVQSGSGAWSGSVSTGADGGVELHGLPASAVEVSAYGRGALKGAVGRVTFDLTHPLRGVRTVLLEPPPAADADDGDDGDAGG